MRFPFTLHGNMQRRSFRSQIKSFHKKKHHQHEKRKDTYSTEECSSSLRVKLLHPDSEGVKGKN